jgi:5-dehydro-4-deoxyglucarate dehydratase
VTAELSQVAYRGIGIPQYSSTLFAMAPGVETAHYRAHTTGDEATRLRLLDLADQLAVGAPA